MRIQNKKVTIAKREEVRKSMKRGKEKYEMNIAVLEIITNARRINTAS